MEITAVAEPTEQDFLVLKNGLNGYNERFTGKIEREKVSAFVKSDTGETLGGILGEIYWGWLHVQGLWVHESIRSQKAGSRLLKQLEEYAFSKGIQNYRLETTTFQALGFYQKQGYQLFGELPDMPPGFTSYFLQKQI
ncbi:GNAT family N-acetyltransferase [Bacterioplanes sanyensis]|uniref:GNAT family N-acetyltransferase n=1 Tax=Bacterioplanes sanyensis TaxID=1249553 RepID=A0A222FG88_9GAMM|nr:GNAT family N-acetyltransferase [Bacterioplanes sanyensis]ASP38087.1 GNAT family N-acetyltransferase [Bacterioplanes sanyensis]